MRSFVLSGVILLAVLPSTVWGQAPAGAEFQVNTYTTNAQSYAAVASDVDGNFVVVWQSDAQDGSGYGIFALRFSAAGAAQGAEFRVNSYTTSLQRAPAVASDPNGNFVVVWDGYGAGGAFGIFGRRFNSKGIIQGAEFQVNSSTTVGVRLPAVARDPSGSFVVVWQSFGQDGDINGVFGRRFNAAGTPQGAEFQVNSYTTGTQSHPAVAMEPGGGFVVVWSSPDAGFSGIFGRRFDAAGAPQGIEFQLNSYATGSQDLPAVAMDKTGGFVVVWRSFGQDGDSAGAFGRGFDASGTPLGADFRVNSYTTGAQGRNSAIASDPDGDFVVAWQSVGQDGGGYGVFGQRYGDLIFQDGFESGDLSRWSAAATDVGNLSVSGAAAMGGTSFGLQAFVNDTNSLFVQDDTPNAEDRYRARFYFDTNGFDPGEASFHFRTRIFIAFDPSGFRVVTVVLKRQTGAYSVEARVKRNDGSRVDTGFFPISDGPHFVELDWQRATGLGASNGSLQMWIDDGPVATLSGIDNDVSPVGFARLGALAIKTGAGGTLFFDQFESRRQRYIGPG